ncbi:serine/threonine protein kinase [Rhodopirellula sp. SWK7]|uniref:serine/threonine protein kinase n=1 Tax=Rhodopirellula sp. SWK7 TaxID=595460 RepID=UPI0002BF0FDA|nr:serine/threonine-protein kinase [Rhodopirellula sp. SWK7]EMI44346.1 serine/threonine protein kinase [Rhodopirellula sp. SWK7]
MKPMDANAADLGSHDELIKRWESSGEEWTYSEILRRAKGNEALARRVERSIAEIEARDSGSDFLLRQACQIDTADTADTVSGMNRDPFQTDITPLPLMEDLDSRMRLTRRYHLANGGIGIVWIYRDENFGRDVAVKFLNPDHATSKKKYEVFMREAEITAKLDHPGIPPVLAAGESDSGQPYFVMRLISGQGFDGTIAELHSIASSAKSNATTYLRRTLGQLATVCRIVDYARTRRVVHADIKPANIRVGTHGEVMLLDWGMATVVDRSVAGPSGPMPTLQLSDGYVGAKVTGGTPCYISPEIWSGCTPTPSIDIYALGVILYEILGGRLPIQPDSTRGDATAIKQSFADRALNADYPDINEISRKALGNFPGRHDLCAVVRKAMAVSPVQRYATALQLAQDLENVLADRPVSVRRPNATTRLMRIARRHKTIAVAIALLLIGTVLSSIFINLRQRQYAANLAQQQASTAAHARAAANQRNLAMKTLASFAADQVVGEIGARYQVLQQAAADPFIIRQMQSLSNTEVSSENGNDDVKQSGTMDRISDWLQHRFEATAATTRADSWWVLDVKGYQRGRAPRSSTIGQRFAHRNYFHGRNVVLSENQFEGILHSPYLSTVYVSESTGFARVALVYPIRNVTVSDEANLSVRTIPQNEGDVIGLVGMSINVDSFATLQIPQFTERISLHLVDARRYQIGKRMSSGVILHHGNADEAVLSEPSAHLGVQYAPPSWLTQSFGADSVWVGWQPGVEFQSSTTDSTNRFTAIAPLDWRDVDRRSHLGDIRLPDWLVVVQR